MVEIKVNKRITVNQLLTLYKSAGFVEEKWSYDSKRLQTMLDHTQLTATMWENGQLIGMARCLTDYEDSCYLSEIVILPAYQRKGLGKQLLKTIQAYLGSRVTIVLRADPEAIGFYKALGYQKLSKLVRIRREA
ncbi:GNAT family N-acetyltransferase [Lentilactobacillus farraginis]|nr:export cytoplasm protein SecA ATPase RNA helicase [Lentilactobacillus farraginis DSM 18382 = JCM 14108]